MPAVELGHLLYAFGSFLTLIGILVVLVAFSHKEEVRKDRFGGVIVIGPFPIVFGSSSRMMKIMMALALAFIAIFLLATFLPSLMS